MAESSAPIAQDSLIQAYDDALETRFFPLFSRAATGFGKVGLAGEWLWVNQKLCDLTGYTKEELLAKTFQDITHPDDVEADLTNMKKVVAGELDINLLEKRYIRKDGSIVWITLTATLVRNRDNEPQYFIVLVEDITDKKQAEQALRTHEVRMRRLFDANIIGIVFADTQGRVLEANDAYLQMLGYTREEFKRDGIDWRNITPPEFRENDERAIAQLKASGACKPFEKQYFHKDGHRIDVLLAVALLEGSDNQCVAYYLDMNETKQLQRDLEQAREIAEVANLRKSQFVANMSHELRTPLNAIIGYSEMILQGMEEDPEKQKKFIQNIAMSGHHLLTLINDILDLSKIEAGKQMLSIQPIDLVAFMNELCETMRQLAAEKNITLHCDLHPDLKTIDADPTKLKQIFLNLVSNAIKFNKPGGQIWIRVSHSGDRKWMICEVEDTGIGIAQDKLNDVFTEFYQVDPSASRQHEGTGLGLTLTRQLLQLHGGHIAVKSAEGKGSTFTFHLPLKK